MMIIMMMMMLQDSDALRLTFEGRVKTLFDESERKSREIESLKQEVSTFQSMLHLTLAAHSGVLNTKDRVH